MTDFIKNFAKEENPPNNEVLKEFDKPKSKEQQKKQEKIKKRKKRQTEVPYHDTIEEQNKKMNKRVPKIRERSTKTTL